jgi:hypothetical protein
VRKPVIILILLLVLGIGAIFFISMQRNTPVIVVEVTLAEPQDNNSEHIISQVNASLSYARKMEVQAETPLNTPGITVLLIQDQQVQSGWYSVGINASGIYKNYTITIKPHETLNTSRPFVVLTRVLDPVGKEVSVKRTEYKIS